MRATAIGAVAALALGACVAEPHLTPGQRMQQDLGFLSTREFLSLEAADSFGVPLRSLPPRGEAPTTTVRLLWTGRSGWLARASIPGHPGDCIMAGGLIPESAFAYTTVRHKGADPQDAVCDSSAGSGTTGWQQYVRRYLSLPLEHAVRSYTGARAEGRPISADSAVQPGVLGYSGLHRELLWSDDRSWAAETWLAAAPGQSCVVRWGDPGEHAPPVTRGGIAATAAAVVVCDTVASTPKPRSSRRTEIGP